MIAVIEHWSVISVAGAQYTCGAAGGMRLRSVQQWFRIAMHGMTVRRSPGGLWWHEGRCQSGPSMHPLPAVMRYESIGDERICTKQASILPLL